MDIEKQVAYWRKGSKEDLAAAESLVAERHYRHGLFFAHLAVEKSLKALVVRRTRNLPPRTHNLMRLAELAALNLDRTRAAFLQEMNQYQLEGRYPDRPQIRITGRLAQRELRRARETLSWFKSPFPA